MCCSSAATGTSRSNRSPRRSPSAPARSNESTSRAEATATSTANASGWARCSCRKSCAASTTTSKIRFSPIFPIRPRAPFSDWSEDWTNTASISAPKGFFTRTARSPNSGSRRSCGSSPVSRKWRSRTSRCGRSSRRTTTATIWWPTSTTSPTARYVPEKTIW